LRYIAKLLLLLNPLYIDGVSYYPDTHRLGNIINGSLWTLLQEAQFYGIIIILAAIRWFNVILPALGVLFGTILFYLMLQGVIAPGERLTNLLYALASISTGMMMHFVYARIGKNRLVSLACILGLIASFPFGLLAIFFPMLAAYPLIHLGMSNTIRLGNVTRFGDVTYGTYLYGWPIQQIIRANFISEISGWSLFFLSWPLALLCGWLSWHLIERHFTFDRVALLWTRAISSLRPRDAAPVKQPK
jgi:peptidoglycan/LPS O-acetylase OafA/YrhL